MPVRISHPTCCLPTLTPTPSAHPLRAPAATLSMPLPPARHPLCPTATALSVPLPPPSPSSRRRRAGVCSYRAAPARSALLHIMAAVLGGGGSRTTTVGMNSGCAACNPYPAPSCALRRRVPLCHRHPLHAAAALYTPPPPPSLLCHPRCPYVPSPVSPLAAASTCSAALVCGLRACATRSPGPSGCTLPSHVSRPHPTSHTCPRATPLRPPCLGPVPGPIHSRAPHLGPHRVRPRLLGPIRGCALHLSPHRVRPRLPGPIHGCAPHLSPCHVRPRLLGPIRGHATRSRDHVCIAFASHSCATEWHTRIGSAWETVHTYTLDTVYEHV